MNPPRRPYRPRRKGAGPTMQGARPRDARGVQIARGRDLIPSRSRETALGVLLAAEKSGRFVADLVHLQIADAPLSAADRALVTELVQGVVRRRATLDAVIGAYSDTKIWRLDSRLLWILRLAIYQMLFLTRIPARAAVDEAVKLARREGLGWLTGFANGLLRTIARSITPAGLLADRVAGVRKVIPIEGERTIVAGRAVLPDPAADLTAYLAAAYSYPEWLVHRWLAHFEDRVARALLVAGNERPLIYLRANRLRTTREALIARLAEAGIQARPADAPEAVLLLGCHPQAPLAKPATLGGEGPQHPQGRPPAAPGLEGGALSVRGGTPMPLHTAISDLPGFAEGHFYVQDLTAMRVAPRLKPQPAERILDLCAAPGGKATHLAELMQNSGAVVASDLSPDRLALVAENAARLGTTIVEAVPPDALEGDFDAVLLDAPCTNTGVLSRRADARWRQADETLARAVQEQDQLLDHAAARLRPGGRLLYSTCSIEPEEDRRRVDDFLARHPDFALVEDELTLPDPTRDGGYAALMRRT